MISYSPKRRAITPLSRENEGSGRKILGAHVSAVADPPPKFWDTSNTQETTHAHGTISKRDCFINVKREKHNDTQHLLHDQHELHGVLYGLKRLASAINDTRNSPRKRNRNTIVVATSGGNFIKWLVRSLTFVYRYCNSR